MLPLFAAFLFGASTTFGAAGDQDGPDAKKNDVKEYHQSFKGLTEPPPGWDFYGPNAAALVKFEPDGMRLTLPRGHMGQHPHVGLNARVAVEGDFDFIVSFEILDEPEPADAGKDQTRFSLDVVLDAPHHDAATLSRRVSAWGGHQFFPWMRVWDEASGKSQQPSKKGLPAKAKKGRFRIARTGADLSYFVSEGADQDFTLLQKSSFSVDPSIEIRLVGTTGGEKAQLDVRFTNFKARAEKMAGFPEGTAGADEPEQTRSKTPSRGWLAAALLIGLAIAVLFAVALVGFLVYSRARRAAKPAAAATTTEPETTTASFPCPECGRKLKSRFALSGKRVKCVQCGKTVLVP